ncbi:uncharacterized protein [Spinacia oleracea]|uniref:Uncharacterized protein n=1 Tax=Spinacia oleracea TaxID=3562 RepID=A0ABM3QGQ4_SPIOL|nr:uncharacterized protein LOC130459297 [Spinacia oleracea]
MLSHPYAASWIREVCRRVPLSASRIAWRVLPVSEVIWRPFADAPIPVSAARAHFLSLRRVLLPGVYHHMWYLGERVSLQHSTGDRLVPKDPPRSMLVPGDELAQLYLTARGDAVCLPWENFVDRRGRFEDLLGRLAPPVRFVLPEEEVDPEDIPFADRVIRYENSGGEQVEVTILVASPPHRRSYDAVPEHYAAAPWVGEHRWMLMIDSLKRHCAKLTQKLSGRDGEKRRRGRRGSVDREPQAETSLRQEGPSLDLRQGSRAGTFQRHSDADRGAAPLYMLIPPGILLGVRAVRGLLFLLLVTTSEGAVLSLRVRMLGFTGRRWRGCVRLRCLGHRTSSWRCWRLISTLPLSREFVLLLALFVSRSRSLVPLGQSWIGIWSVTGAATGVKRLWLTLRLMMTPTDPAW